LSVAWFHADLCCCIDLVWTIADRLTTFGVRSHFSTWHSLCLSVEVARPVTGFSVADCVRQCQLLENLLLLYRRFNPQGEACKAFSTQCCQSLWRNAIDQFSNGESARSCHPLVSTLWPNISSLQQFSSEIDQLASLFLLSSASNDSRDIEQKHTDVSHGHIPMAVHRVSLLIQLTHVHARCLVSQEELGDSRHLDLSRFFSSAIGLLNFNGSSVHTSDIHCDCFSPTQYNCHCGALALASQRALGVLWRLHLSIELILVSVCYIRPPAVSFWLSRLFGKCHSC